jgi:hypothetical protein
MAKWGSSQREISILSNVQTLEAWRGNLVHSVISDYLVPQIQQGIIPTKADLQAFALDRANKQLNFSTNKKYREPYMTKKKAEGSYAIIWEDELATQISHLTKPEALQEIDLALTNLLLLPELLEDLLQYSWLIPEATLLLPAKGNSIPITGRIDLMAASPSSSKPLLLIDWKVDRKQQHDKMPVTTSKISLSGLRNYPKNL